MHGFWNRLLRVDLSSQRTTVEKLPDTVLKAGLGGKGLGNHLLLNEGGNSEPLSPTSSIIFACGPLTGTIMPGASRYGVYARSPLTRGYAESYSGGHLAPSFKRCGYDAVIIQGKSPSPVYLHISDSGVEFRPAQHLWGKESYEAEEAILAEVGRPGVQAAVIGPAGENLVPFACIVNNKWRQAGRAGMGAVMGSKKLKGIAFSGQSECRLHDTAALKKLVTELTLLGNRDRTVSN
ncbi:MAG: aldehyde ferredoxin oxidoreductase N-terminal domain-containing protein, partial [Chloroflexota bacterium]